MAQYYARRGMGTIALRYGMFVPEPFLHAGIRFLYGGVDERDVASAVVLGLRRALAGPGWIGAFNIESALPFTADDGRGLREEPLAAIGRHWPDAPELLERVGTKPWGPINEVYEIDKAENELEWRPRYGFDAFLQALREGRSSL